MKEEKIKKIGAIIVLILMTIMLLLIGLRVIGKMLYKLNIKNPITMFLANKEIPEETIKVNWNEMYPLEQDSNNTDASKMKKKNVIEKVKLKVKNIEKKFDNNTCKELIGYEKLIENSYLYDKIIGYTLVSNTDGMARAKIGDYWCKLDVALDIKQRGEKLKEFSKYVKDKDIDFLYVQALYKIEKNNNYISKIYKDYANENADKLLNEIQDEVDYIDLRDNIKKHGKKYLELFFKTDHHWKPETGIWATGEIANALNTKYNYNIDTELISDIDNYNIDEYKELYLGSDGKYVTLKNALPEDISIITPKFETDLVVKIPDKVPYKQGNFQDTLIDYSKLNGIDFYKTNYYAAYGYGNRAVIEIQNKNVENNNRLLIIKDSFANVVAPYLSLGVKNCSIVDLRQFNGSLKTYIEEYKPDTIIIIYYPGALGDERMWKYE